MQSLPTLSLGRSITNLQSAILRCFLKNFQDIRVNILLPLRIRSLITWRPIAISTQSISTTAALWSRYSRYPRYLAAICLWRRKTSTFRYSKSASRIVHIGRSKPKDNERQRQNAPLKLIYSYICTSNSPAKKMAGCECFYCFFCYICKTNDKHDSVCPSR